MHDCVCMTVFKWLCWDPCTWKWKILISSVYKISKELTECYRRRRRELLHTCYPSLIKCSVLFNLIFKVLFKTSVLPNSDHTDKTLIMQNCEHFISRLLFPVKTNLLTPHNLLLESPGGCLRWFLALVILAMNCSKTMNCNKFHFRIYYQFLQITSTQFLLYLTSVVLQLSKYGIAKQGATEFVLTLQGCRLGFIKPDLSGLVLRLPRALF